MILAGADDRPAIEAFLRNHIATSMFPLSNMRRYAMDEDHPHSTKFWLRWEAGRIIDLLGVTREGMLFPQCPNRPWGDVKAILTGNGVKGMLGDTEQIAQLRQVLGLSDQAGLDSAEPLYRLALSDLRVPDLTDFSLRPLGDAPRDLVIGWRRAYLQEVLPMPGEDFAQKAIDDIDHYIDSDTHRVLYEAETPVAMTGFNAVLPEAVQVGAVYTPPADRSRGLARRAVAMHLIEAHESGVQDAILFAASLKASKAYEAIGFERIGDFTILFYEDAQVIYG